MGKNVEFNSWFNGVKQRNRKRKDVGEGKDFQKGEAAGGARAAYGTSGGGARKTAQTMQHEKDRNYMQRKMAEKREVMNDPQKKAAQQKKNRKALSNIVHELRDREGADYGSIMDFAQEYVPTDDRLGKAARNAKNRSVARKTLKNRQ